MILIVRLIGVNAPELEKKSVPELTALREDFLFADSAAAFLKYLIEGKIIKLTFDRDLYDYIWKAAGLCMGAGCPR